MADSPKLSFTVKNKSIPTTPGAQIVHYVEGITTRGKINDPEELIRSWPQFLKAFGGYRTDTDFPRLCKRLLDRGSYLRVARIMHYTDITDADSLDATVASVIVNSWTLQFNQAFVEGEKIVININGVKKVYTVIMDSPLMYKQLAKLIQMDYPEVIGIVYDAPTFTFQIFFANGTSIVNSCTVQSINGLSVTVTSTGGGTAITDAGNIVSNLFFLNPIAAGADSNNVSVVIGPATNGNPDYFNIQILHSQDPYMNELYENLIIPSPTSIADATFLEVIAANSNLVEVEYTDLSGADPTAFPLVPVPMYMTYVGGDDGTPPDVLDYLGDPNSKTGMYAFDEFDDGYTISAPELVLAQFASGLDGYVSMRADLLAWHRTPGGPSYTADALVEYRNNTNIDNKLSVFTGGGIFDTNQITGKKDDISELADGLGCLSYTFNNEKPWYSSFGTTRGQIPNALGVVNNFGPSAKYNDLNLLSQNGINMVIRRDNKIFIQNNVTARKITDIEQNVNVVMLELYIMKVLRPKLEAFLDEPNDIPTWQRMYYVCKPFLDQLYTERGIYEPAIWKGDQDASSLSDLQINDPVAVQNGEYIIQLEISPVPSLRKIKVEIVITTAGVAFNFAA